MRILILGGAGMLGHQLVRSLSGRHEVGVTYRSGAVELETRSKGTPAATFPDVDARRLDDLVAVLGRFKPQVVVNGVGIVKQRGAAKVAVPSIEVNALLPHRLAEVCRITSARLIHLSTDCVFSGAKGNYSEADAPDPADLYGRTKLLGEVGGPGCLTLRTSIIGLELANKAGLVEWFLSQRGRVGGYRRAIYSGLTTSEMAKVIETIIVNHEGLDGVWHLSSDPISKFALLVSLATKLRRADVEVLPDDTFACDRSLDSALLRQRLGYRPPPWEAMLEGLAREIMERESR
jgi:dTDP-4-dehydrorhamnose reductase